MRTISRGNLLVLGLVAGVSSACVDTVDDATIDESATMGDTAVPPALYDSLNAPPDGTTLDATLSEWAVQLERDSIPAGQVTFSVRNAGEHGHVFEVEGEGGEWETPPIAPGSTIQMSMLLAAGEYEVYCPLDDANGNHEEQGMTTRLRVF